MRVVLVGAKCEYPLRMPYLPKMAIDVLGTLVLAVAVAPLVLTTTINPVLLIVGSAMIAWALLH